MRLVEPFASRVLPAHPNHLRVITESTRKSDRLDARVLAEFLALDMIPEAYRPTPRQREHRRLVRHRYHLRQRIPSLRNKIRGVLCAYNADRPELFSAKGLQFLKAFDLSASDRFAVEQLLATWELYLEQWDAVEKRLRAFAKEAPLPEREGRELLHSIPGVGEVTTEIVLAELGDVRRFRSQKHAVSYAGLAPGRRESAGKAHALGIEKTGSGLRRWTLVEAAWPMVRYTARWRTVFERLAERTGRKKAMVAVARRLLGLMVSILKNGQPYEHAYRAA